MTDQNNIDPIADVPSAEDLVSEEGFADAETSTEEAGSRSWKQSLSYAAVAAALVVGGVGGYAAGNSGGDHNRIEFANNQQGGLPGEQGGLQGPGAGKGHHGHDQFGGPQGQPGLPGQPGQDRGVDPDGDNWTGTNKQDQQLAPNGTATPSTSPSSSQGTVTQ